MPESEFRSGARSTEAPAVLPLSFALSPDRGESFRARDSLPDRIGSRCAAFRHFFLRAGELAAILPPEEATT